MNKCLGFIGGSGLYDLDFLEDFKFHEIQSSMGKPSDKIIEGKLKGNKVFFYQDMVKVINYPHLL